MTYARRFAGLLLVLVASVLIPSATVRAASPSPMVYDLRLLPHEQTLTQAMRARDWRTFGNVPQSLSGTWWARFRINLGAANDQWSIYLGERVCAELYDAGGRLLARTGDLVPYSARIPPTLMPALALGNGYRSGDLLYLHVSGNLSDIPKLHTVRTEQLDQTERGFWIQFILVAGVLGGLAVLRLILGVRLRDPSSFAFVASCLGFIVYELADVRVGWALAWPHLSIPYEAAWNAGLIVFLLGRTTFIRTFVPLARLAPLADRLFLAGVSVLIVRAAIEMFRTFPGSTAVEGLAAFVAFGAAFGGIVYCAKNGSREAWFSLLAFAGFAPLALSTLFSNELRILPPIWLFDHGVEIGICLEAVLLSFGLAERIHSADRERIAAQQRALEIAHRHNEAVSRFVPTEFISHLGRADVTELMLGDHVLSRMSVLFSDIRSFTTLSESMNPDENFQFLNAYLSQLGPVIREHHGFIDKYVGDAIMGLFPGPPDDSVNAAIGLQRQLVVYNDERVRAGSAPISCGVGVHRGDLMLGTIGEMKRMDTTVIADVVNLASRLEGLTKIYGARVLISKSVVDDLEAPQAFALRDLGLIAAKGKAKPTRVYEVLDADDEPVRAAKLAQLPHFEQALAAFKEGRFTQAHAGFAAIAVLCPWDNAVAHYVARADALAQAAPKHWEGVDHMLAK